MMQRLTIVECAMRLIATSLFLIASSAWVFTECQPRATWGWMPLPVLHQEVVRHVQPGLGVQDRFFDEDGCRNVS